MSVRRDDPAAGVDHGLRRAGHEGQHLAQDLVVRPVLLGDVGVAEFGRRREDRLELRLLDVLGDVDHDRPGPAGAGEMERLLHDPRQLVHVHHQIGMLHHRQGHPEEVGLLEGHLADELRHHLPGDRHERDRVHVGVGDRRHQVGGSRPAGGHAHADLAGDPRITLGRERAALLVPGQDDPNLVGPRQRLVELLRGAARISEDDLDPLADQALDDRVGTLHFAADLGLWKLGG